MSDERSAISDQGELPQSGLYWLFKGRSLIADRSSLIAPPPDR
jgi:hypothetical protein